MANSIKMAYLLMGVVLTQGILFYLYFDGVWLNPLALVGMVGLPLSLLVDAYQRQRHWLKRACLIQGRIISYRRPTQYKQNWVTLTVEYVVNGMSRTCEAYWRRDYPVPPVGSSIDLWYNPDRPGEVQASKSGWSLVVLWSFLVGYSLIALLVIALRG